jgi:hypothetical protein
MKVIQHEEFDEVMSHPASLLTANDVVYLMECRSIIARKSRLAGASSTNAKTWGYSSAEESA